MQIELILLILSILFFASILAGKAGSRFGVPALLLFLGVGMLFGSDGLDTKIKDIRPVLGPGIMLATVGVLVTAVATGLILYLIRPS